MEIELYEEEVEEETEYIPRMTDYSFYDYTKGMREGRANFGG